MRGLAALVLCATALVVVAGCGGGGSDEPLSKDEYLEEFVDIRNDLESSFEDLSDPDIDTTEIDQVADLADRLGESLDELAGRVDALTPPEEIESTHDKLVSGLEEFAAWAHELADQIRTATAAELVDLLQELGLTSGFDPAKVPGAAEIQEAVEEYEDAGYELGETTETETETETEGAAGDGDPVAGKTVFVANCGSCHTLADAGTSGAIGPNLDDSQPSEDLVVERVTNGQGVMPSFADTLSEQQIADVAAYVSSAAGG